MAPSYCIELTPDEQAQLLVIARGSIQHGFVNDRPLAIEPSRLTGALTEPHGNFVTLTQRGTLRGCVGTLKGSCALAENIAVTAFSAARDDTRFAPLSAAELEQTRIEISVLSRPEPIQARSFPELLAKLRPCIDGLLVQDGWHRGTLLPKVWERFPDPREFMTQLMAKAGLPDNYWSDSIQFHRYETISFAERAVEPATLA
jgi:AmmeMemoRadiSam system protein A